MGAGEFKLTVDRGTPADALHPSPPDGIHWESRGTLDGDGYPFHDGGGQWESLGFAFKPRQRISCGVHSIGASWTQEEVGLTLPYWFLALVASLVPGLWIARFGVLLAQYWRGRRRRSAGLCPSCGYDLRATPQRCPECGRMPAQVQSPP
jgi:hypothetical protein